LARQSDGDFTGTQRDAWLEETAVLLRVRARYAGAIYLEFAAPRMSRRSDALVIMGPVIFVLELEAGEARLLSQDVDQVIGYTRDPA
jgi:hypothetical protein